MSKSNEQIVRDWFETRRRAVAEGFWDHAAEGFWDAHVADDVTYHLPARNPNGGDHRGKNAVRKLLAALHERSGHTFRLEIHDITSSAHHAVALVRATAQRHGKSLDSNQAHVFEIRDGRITDIWGIAYDRYAVDEFWS